MKILLLTLASLSCTFLCVALLMKRFTRQSTKKSKERRTSARAQWLAQADVELSVMQFWLINTSIALLVALMVFTLTKTPTLASIFGITAGCLPYFFIARKRLQVSKELMIAWPDALRDISAVLSSGNTLSFALHSLSKTGPEALIPHMKRFVTLEKHMGFSPALEIVREEMSDSTSDRIIEVLIVSHERGGRVVREIIDDLIDTTVDDIAISESIATESLEMKINSRSVVVLPWCVLLLLTFGGGIFQEFYQSTQGTLVILLGLLLSILGTVILSRLGRSEIEPRVFHGSVR